MLLVRLFLGLTVASLRRKGLSSSLWMLSWWAPAGEKHFRSLLCRFALGLSQGRKVYDSQGSWQHWKNSPTTASPPLASHRTLSFLLPFPMESSPSICLSNLPLDTAIQARFSPWMHSLCERGFSPGMCCLSSLMPEGQTKTSMLGRSFTDIPTCLISTTFG